MRENADHSGFSQNEAGPANAQSGDGLKLDTSALEAWRATGAERNNRTLGEESTVNNTDRRISREYEGKNGLAAETTGKLPLDHVPADAAFSLGTDASETYLRRNPPPDDLRESESPVEEEAPLEDVPDADEIQADSPVDPAALQDPDQHGIDLLNGVGGVDDETGRKLPKYF
ncbi:MAG: hypothetical protein ACQEXX_19025 [Bacillota bacterium]